MTGVLGRCTAAPLRLFDVPFTQIDGVHRQPGASSWSGAGVQIHRNDSPARLVQSHQFLERSPVRNVLKHHRCTRPIVEGRQTSYLRQFFHQSPLSSHHTRSECIAISQPVDWAQRQGVANPTHPARRRARWGSPAESVRAVCRAAPGLAARRPAPYWAIVTPPVRPARRSKVPDLPRDSQKSPHRPRRRESGSCTRGDRDRSRRSRHCHRSPHHRGSARSAGC